LSHAPPQGRLVQGADRRCDLHTEEAHVANGDDRDAPTPGEVNEDAKARFREALERKKAASHRTTQGSGNTGAVHGSETKGPSQRTFRRRSGSS
jgi:hypothetical protein